MEYWNWSVAELDEVNIERKRMKKTFIDFIELANSFTLGKVQITSVLSLHHSIIPKKMQLVSAMVLTLT